MDGGRGDILAAPDKAHAVELEDEDEDEYGLGLCSGLLHALVLHAAGPLAELLVSSTVYSAQMTVSAAIPRHMVTQAERHEVPAL